MTQDTTASGTAINAAEQAGSPYLFVHIPKTAGMSFGASLKENQQVICDYGLEGPKTSRIILETKYHHYDPYALLSEIGGSDVWLTGHFKILEFCDFTECRKIVSFVREPFERLISNFNHVRTNVDKTVQFEEYYEHPKHQNVQHKYLLGVPKQCIGYVGVTESIDESYKIINAGLSLSLEIKHSNINRHRTIDPEAVPPEVEARIKEYNKLDYALYDWALRNHRERYQFLNEGKPWCHGFYTIVKDRMIYGVAFFASSDKPVEVHVHKNGVHFETLTANLFHHEHVKANFPRNRYIAFKLPDIAADCKYTVFVAETGQALNFHPHESSRKPPPEAQ